MNYYIRLKSLKRNTAGSKAPDDIYITCDRLGMRPINFWSFPSASGKWIKKMWLCTVAPIQWMKLFLQIREGDYVVYQHPMYGHRLTAIAVKKIRKIKKCHFVVLIHDLESLRGGIVGVVKHNEKVERFSDSIMLNAFDHIICHNQKMKEYFAGQGIGREKIVTLNIFDYLCENNHLVRSLPENPSVVVAGNLAKGKAGYAYKLKKDRISYHLYGINFEDKDLNSNIKYKGAYPPDILPLKMEGEFGLVWDGTSTESCVGNTGEYLKYNNPHKASLYLASNMPVIIWKEAALADFIVKNRLGFAVASLDEIERCIEESREEYDEIIENVQKVGEKIRRGYFFENALKKVMKESGHI